MTEIFVNSDSVRLWTIAQGSGVPVVLCNGGPGCCDYLAPAAAMLDDLAQVIRFEACSCGRSDQVPPYTVATCLADLEAIRQHYRVERWIVEDIPGAPIWPWPMRWGTRSASIS